MADRKISDLTALTTPAAGDYLPIVDISEVAASSKNKRITIEELLRGAPDGTAAAPSIGFESDPNTGIYSPGADQLAISTNGAGRLFVDASGIIGVKRTTQGGVGAFEQIQIGGNAAAGSLTTFFGQNNGSAGGIISNAYYDASNNIVYSQTSANFGISRLYLSDGTLVFSNAAAGVGGTTASLSERLRITSAGLVGIGTSVPDGLLTVRPASGNAQVFIRTNDTTSRSQLIFGDSADSNTGGIQYNHTTDNLEFHVGNLGEKMTLDATGRLGIGTTSPTKSLEVNSGADTDVARFTNNSGVTATIGVAAGISTLDLPASTGFRLRAGGSAGERLQIDSSGRLLVGTPSARSNFFNTNISAGIQLEGLGGTNRLLSVVSNTNDAFSEPNLILGKTRGTSLGSNTVVQSDDPLGSVCFQGADGSEFVEAASIKAFVDGTPGANDMPGRLVFSTTADGASSPTERMRIHATGNTSLSGGISVGGLGDPGTAIIFNGSVIGAGAGTYPLKWNSSTGVVTYDTSSALLKESIVDCPYGIEDVKQLQPRKYLRIDDQREEIGFIADEVIQVMPEYVPVGPKSVITKNEDDTEEIPLGVHYDKLTAVLTKALQEAIAKIETLEAKVAALEAA